MVQLSHPYLTTGKTIALTIWAFVGKVMSLLFNALLWFVIAFLPKSKCLLLVQLPSTESDFWAQENQVCHCFHFPPNLWSLSCKLCEGESFLLLPAALVNTWEWSGSWRLSPQGFVLLSSVMCLTPHTHELHPHAFSGVLMMERQQSRVRNGGKTWGPNRPESQLPP